MEKLPSTTIEGKGYRYIRDMTMCPPEVIDSHHIILKNDARKGRVSCMVTVVLLVPATFYKFLFQGNSVAIALLWGLLIGYCLVRTIKWKQVIEGESYLTTAAQILSAPLLIF